jgi:hypothetical protein
MRELVLATAIVMLGPVICGAFVTRPAAAQDTAVPPRAHPPARIRVNPLAPYPGPNAVRQCDFWLATENRPSGTVIVPRQHCWWERG